MKKAWDKVTPDDVLKAIEIFENRKESYPEPKNTFLLFNNKKYPAKHIRGIAYQIATKSEITKEEYNGGKETAKFFKKLGFNVEYNPFPVSK